uniref:Uncharacterized protein n=1 Tax=Homalodisca liturata TaxID=320908 RepID=A0A1B6IKJ1_9HEMI
MKILDIFCSVCRNRKIFLLLVVLFPFLYYLWSRLMLSMQPARGLWDDHPAFYLLEYSLENKLMMLQKSVDEFNANIQHEPLNTDENPFLPFVGNGMFGVVIKQDSLIYLRKDRVLTLPLNYHPIVWVEFELMSKTARALDYVRGVAHTVSCYINDICITSQYYAHRTLPNIFVQDIEVVNPASYNAKVYLSREVFDQDSWAQAEVGSIKLTKNDVGARNGSEEYDTVVGPVVNEFDEFFVSIIAMRIPTHFYAKPKSKTSLQILTAICESDHNLPSSGDKSEVKAELQSLCLKQLKSALKKTAEKVYEEHTNAWQQLWATGISISKSKAKDALNGDKINATMYYVLSNVRSPLDPPPLTIPTGCYGNIHHTFQATNLWNDLSTFFNVQKATSFWLLTLQKQGCDNLVALGAPGVMQAMVLSFGSFKFSSQHLEFNMHPKFLHRDYTFRRLQYGNLTQVNVTVQLQEDNKAILLVALEKSDRPFYACDGGCLDGPVQLGRMKLQFPVKLTDPVTAILYISPDRKHLDDMRHAIHVQEVGEAPAHEHSVIALHKHGHHLGGLPTFFWVSVCFLIIVFHLFLFKLIYNEYCGGYQEKKNFQERHKIRYSKL